MTECKRCGLCCFLVIDGKISSLPCRFLKFNEDGTTTCKVYYRNRVGRDIGAKNKCHNREDVHLNYRNCSYNREEWGEELDVDSEVKVEK